jgi:hypothetical protein
MTVEYYQSVLEEYGIKSQTRNILLSSLGGFLPPAEIYPELWVLEEDFEKASKLLAEIKVD